LLTPSAVVCHFSYHTQMATLDATDLLSRYRRLSSETGART
jgi:hypothetical protein